MKSKLMTFIKNVADPKTCREIKNLQRISHAPYDILIYQDLLGMAQADDHINIVPFTARRTSRNWINLFLRHDIDTLECIKKVDLLLDCNLNLGLPAGIYFRVDDDEYCLKDHKNLVNDYREQGFETGLHTVCYTHDNYLDQFKFETQKFADEVGFQPKTFTIHGLGNTENRRKFRRQIVKNYHQFGYDSYPRFHSLFRTSSKCYNYHYVIEDCHLDIVTNQRFILADFKMFPLFMSKGLNYLVLTHPCHWTK